MDDPDLHDLIAHIRWHADALHGLLHELAQRPTEERAALVRLALRDVDESVVLLAVALAGHEHVP